MEWCRVWVGRNFSSSRGVISRLQIKLSDLVCVHMGLFSTDFRLFV